MIYTVPEVTAALVPVKVKKKKGCFRVEFSATYSCEADPDPTAVNGHPVINSELVILHHRKKKKCRIKVDYGSSADCGNEGTANRHPCLRRW